MNLNESDTALLDALAEAERVIRWAAQESTGKVKAELVRGWLHHADKIRAIIASHEMKMTEIHTVYEAREKAVAWQHWMSTQSLSYDELAQWQDYFTTLTEKFPELQDEFKENGIL
jgi:hypothetical protein